MLRRIRRLASTAQLGWALFMTNPRQWLHAESFQEEMSAKAEANI